MAYSTPSTFTAAPLTTTQMNLVRSNGEAVAKPPTLFAYNTAAVATANSTFTAMTWNATQWMRDFTLVSNTARPVESGYFMMVCRIIWGSSGGAGVRIIRHLLNGVPTYENHDESGGTAWQVAEMSHIFAANASDQIGIHVMQQSGGAMNVNANSYMAIYMISRL